MGAKEKLERQLNDNPELKERFNLQMKSITNNVRALTEPLTELTDNLNSQLEAFRLRTEEMREATIKKFGILESDYNTLVAKYLSYLKKEGMILPLDFNEFFSWIASCRYPDEPFAILEIQPNDFKLFHEYEKRRINNTGWNENKEWLFLNNQSQGRNPDSKGNKHKKQMNLDRLDNLMNQAFRELFDRFKSDLKEFVPNYSKMQISALASVIYDSDILHKNAKPKDFKSWQEQFCDILGVEESTYKPSNIKDEKKQEMKNTYYYLLE